MHRRTFLVSLAAALPAATSPARPRRPRILLRSSWQVVNIGDIAHTPGRAGAARHAHARRRGPSVGVRRPDRRGRGDGASAVSRAADRERQDRRGRRAVESSARRRRRLVRLPAARIGAVAGRRDAMWPRSSSTPASPSACTASPMARSCRATMQRCCRQATFVFFRDSVSRWRRARKQRVSAPVLDFGPDGAFACDLRNDAAAAAFLAEHGLDERPVRLRDSRACGTRPTGRSAAPR